MPVGSNRSSAQVNNIQPGIRTQAVIKTPSQSSHWFTHSQCSVDTLRRRTRCLANDVTERPSAVE